MDQTDESVQNALPAWHTHSTVTGAATALGISNHARQQALQANGTRHTDGDDEDEDDLLEAHYAQMQDGGVEPVEEVVTHADQVPSAVPTATSLGSTPGVESVMVKGEFLLFSRAKQAVNGVPKPIGEIDDDDEANMTTEEYEVSVPFASRRRSMLTFRHTQMQWQPRRYHPAQTITLYNMHTSSMAFKIAVYPSLAHSP